MNSSHSNPNRKCTKRATRQTSRSDLSIRQSMLLLILATFLADSIIQPLVPAVRLAAASTNQTNDTSTPAPSWLQNTTIVTPAPTTDTNTSTTTLFYVNPYFYPVFANYSSRRLLFQAGSQLASLQVYYPVGQLVDLQAVISYSDTFDSVTIGEKGCKAFWGPGGTFMPNISYFVKGGDPTNSVGCGSEVFCDFSGDGGSVQSAVRGATDGKFTTEAFFDVPVTLGDAVLSTNCRSASFSTAVMSSSKFSRDPTRYFATITTATDTLPTTSDALREGGHHFFPKETEMQFLRPSSELSTRTYKTITIFNTSTGKSSYNLTRFRPLGSDSVESIGNETATIITCSLADVMAFDATHYSPETALPTDVGRCIYDASIDGSTLHDLHKACLENTGCVGFSTYYNEVNQAEMPLCQHAASIDGTDTDAYISFDRIVYRKPQQAHRTCTVTAASAGGISVQILQTYYENAFVIVRINGEAKSECGADRPFLNKRTGNSGRCTQYYPCFHGVVSAGATISVETTTNTAQSECTSSLDALIQLNYIQEVNSKDGSPAPVETPSPQIVDNENAIRSQLTTKKVIDSPSTAQAGGVVKAYVLDVDAVAFDVDQTGFSCTGVDHGDSVSGRANCAEETRENALITLDTSQLRPQVSTETSSTLKQKCGGVLQFFGGKREGSSSCGVQKHLCGATELNLINTNITGSGVSVLGRGKSGFVLIHVNREDMAYTSSSCEALRGDLLLSTYGVETTVNIPVNNSAATVPVSINKKRSFFPLRRNENRFNTILLTSVSPDGTTAGSASSRAGVWSSGLGYTEQALNTFLDKHNVTRSTLANLISAMVDEPHLTPLHHLEGLTVYSASSDATLVPFYVDEDNLHNIAVAYLGDWDATANSMKASELSTAFVETVPVVPSSLRSACVMDHISGVEADCIIDVPKASNWVKITVAQNDFGPIASADLSTTSSVQAASREFLIQVIKENNNVFEEVRCGETSGFQSISGQSNLCGEYFTCYSSFIYRNDTEKETNPVKQIKITVPNSLEPRSCEAAFKAVVEFEAKDNPPLDDECDEFKCWADRSCIPKSSVCDGLSDCSDSSDEKECGKWFHAIDGHVFKSEDNNTETVANVAGFTACRQLAVVHNALAFVIYPIAIDPDRQCTMYYDSGDGDYGSRILSRPSEYLVTNPGANLYVYLPTGAPSEFKKCTSQLHCSDHGTILGGANLTDGATCRCTCSAGYIGDDCSIAKDLSTLQQLVVVFEASTSRDTPTSLNLRVGSVEKALQRWQAAATTSAECSAFEGTSNVLVEVGKKNSSVAPSQGFFLSTVCTVTSSLGTTSSDELRLALLSPSALPSLNAILNETFGHRSVHHVTSHAVHTAYTEVNGRCTANTSSLSCSLADTIATNTDSGDVIDRVRIVVKAVAPQARMVLSLTKYMALPSSSSKRAEGNSDEHVQTIQCDNPVVTEEADSTGCVTSVCVFSGLSQSSTGDGGAVSIKNFRAVSVAAASDSDTTCSSASITATSAPPSSAPTLASTEPITTADPSFIVYIVLGIVFTAVGFILLFLSVFCRKKQNAVEKRYRYLAGKKLPPSATVAKFLNFVFLREYFTTTGADQHHDHWSIMTALVGILCVLTAGMMYLLVATTTGGTKTNYNTIFTEFHDAQCAASAYSPIPFRIANVPNIDETCQKMEVVGEAFGVSYAAARCFIEDGGAARTFAKVKLALSLTGCESAPFVDIESGTCVPLSSLYNSGDVSSLSRSGYIQVTCAEEAKANAYFDYYSEINNQLPDFATVTSPATVPDSLNRYAAKVASFSNTVQSVVVSPFVVNSKLLFSTTQRGADAVELPAEVGSETGDLPSEGVGGRFASFGVQDHFLGQHDTSRLVLQSIDAFTNTNTTELAAYSPETMTVENAAKDKLASLNDLIYVVANETAKKLQQQQQASVSSSSAALADYIWSDKDYPVGWIFNNFNKTKENGVDLETQLRGAKAGPNAHKYYAVRGSDADMGHHFPQVEQGHVEDGGDGFTISLYMKATESTLGFAFATVDAYEETSTSTSPLVERMMSIVDNGRDGNAVWFNNTYHMYSSLYVNGKDKTLHFLYADPTYLSAGDTTSSSGASPRVVDLKWNLDKLGQGKVFNGLWHHIAVVFEIDNERDRARLVVNGQTSYSQEDWSNCVERRPTEIQHLPDSVPVRSIKSNRVTQGGVIYVGYFNGGIAQLTFTPSVVEADTMTKQGTRQMRILNSIKKSSTSILANFCFCAAFILIVLTSISSGSDVRKYRQTMMKLRKQAAFARYSKITESVLIVVLSSQQPASSAASISPATDEERPATLLVSDHQSPLASSTIQNLLLNDLPPNTALSTGYNPIKYTTATRWLKIGNDEDERFVTILEELARDQPDPHAALVRILFESRRLQFVEEMQVELKKCPDFAKLSPEGLHDMAVHRVDSTIFGLQDTEGAKPTVSVKNATTKIKTDGIPSPQAWNQMLLDDVEWYTQQQSITKWYDCLRGGLTYGMRNFPDEVDPHFSSVESRQEVVDHPANGVHPVVTASIIGKNMEVEDVTEDQEDQSSSLLLLQAADEQEPTPLPAAAAHIAGQCDPLELTEELDTTARNSDVVREAMLSIAAVSANQGIVEEAKSNAGKGKAAGTVRTEPKTLGSGDTTKPQRGAPTTNRADGNSGRAANAQGSNNGANNGASAGKAAPLSPQPPATPPEVPASIIQALLPVITVLQVVQVYSTSWNWPDEYLTVFREFFSLISFDLVLAFPNIPTIVTPIIQLLCGIVGFAFLLYFSFVDNQRFALNVARYTQKRNEEEIMKDPPTREYINNLDTAPKGGNHSAKKTKAPVGFLEGLGEVVGTVGEAPPNAHSHSVPQNPLAPSETTQGADLGVESPPSVADHDKAVSDFASTHLLQRVVEYPFDSAVCKLRQAENLNETQEHTVSPSPKYRMAVLPVQARKEIDVLVGKKKPTTAVPSSPTTITVEEFSGNVYTVQRTPGSNQCTAALSSSSENGKAAAQDSTLSHSVQPVGCCCPDHVGSYLSPQVQSKVWPFIDPPKCCVTVNGVPCGEQLGLMFVCGVRLDSNTEHSHCKFALCKRHFKGSFMDDLKAKATGGIRLVQHRGTGWLVATTVVMLCNIMYTPFMKTAIMIGSCHPFYQCEFENCYQTMDQKFAVAVFLCATMVVIFGIGLPLSQFYLLRDRHNVLHSAFFASEYGQIFQQDEDSDNEQELEKNLKEFADQLDFEFDPEKNDQNRGVAEVLRIKRLRQNDPPFVKFGRLCARIVSYLSSNDQDKKEERDGTIFRSSTLMNMMSFSFSISDFHNSKQRSSSTFSLKKKQHKTKKFLLTSLVKDQEWNRFLATDFSALAILYNQLEYKWMFQAPLLLAFKFILVMPAVLTEPRSFDQRAFVVVAESMFALFIFWSAPYISPILDLLYRLGTIHQMLLLGFVNMEAVRTYEGKESLGGYMIIVTATYLLIVVISLLWIVLHPIIKVRVGDRKCRETIEAAGLSSGLGTTLYRAFEHSMYDQPPLEFNNGVALFQQ